MTESDEPDLLGSVPLEFDSSESPFQIDEEKFPELSDLPELSNEELKELEQATSSLIEYKQAAADRDRAAAERASAETARENARAKRIFLERIGERYLPYAGFLVFGFIPLVVGVSQVLRYTDIRLWVGSGLLGIGIVTAIGLLVLADWERISGLFK